MQIGRCCWLNVEECWVRPSLNGDGRVVVRSGWSALGRIVCGWASQWVLRGSAGFSFEVWASSWMKERPREIRRPVDPLGQTLAEEESVELYENLSGIGRGSVEVWNGVLAQAGE